MRLYHAGTSTDTELFYQEGFRDVLVSYADRGSLEELFWVRNPPPGTNVFLDSGAFAAFTKGLRIDLDEYCDYIYEHHGVARGPYAALDVIGDWEATARNVQHMRARGLDPVPTFHRRSPWGALERFLDDGHRYIALGGLVTGASGGRAIPGRAGMEPYLDEVFGRLEKYWPVKVHAFGLALQWAFERYPFYSADSAACVRGGGFGQVFHVGENEWRWTTAVELAHQIGNMRLVDRRIDGSVVSGRKERIKYNAHTLSALGRYVTDLWVGKGVVWN